jgi:hypothetical protein
MFLSLLSNSSWKTDGTSEAVSGLHKDILQTAVRVAIWILSSWLKLRQIDCMVPPERNHSWPAECSRVWWNLSPFLLLHHPSQGFPMGIQDPQKSRPLTGLIKAGQVQQSLFPRRWWSALFHSTSFASILLVKSHTDLQLNTLLFRGNHKLMKCASAFIATQKMCCTGEQKCCGDYS